MDPHFVIVYDSVFILPLVPRTYAYANAWSGWESVRCSVMYPPMEKSSGVTGEHRWLWRQLTAVTTQSKRTSTYFAVLKLPVPPTPSLSLSSAPDTLRKPPLLLF